MSPCLFLLRSAGWNGTCWQIEGGEGEIILLDLLLAPEVQSQEWNSLEGIPQIHPCSPFPHGNIPEEADWVGK